ncbi:MAG TPA: hypothetical protein VFY63_14345 [Pseudorhizobium sp.]|nr:hypothetical protein [Pseudorhizobium sp.]
MSADARFSIIPGWIVTDGRLKGCDLQVLCLLGRHTDKHGWCRRSQVKMADQLGKARSTVQASIDRLVDIGVLEKHVEPSVDGRDSAHSYRVIYDRAPPSGYDFDAYRDEDEKEYGPIPADQEALPPAGIPAPPAGPESAPPAGPGPAPINDPYLTTQAKREEREREREDGEGEENPKALERRVKALELGKHGNPWPGALGSSTQWAVTQFTKLSPEERRQAEEKRDAYLDECARQRVKPVALGIYLKDRKFLDVVAKPPGSAPVSRDGRIVVPVFGPVWAAARMMPLLDGPVEIEMPDDPWAMAEKSYQMLARTSTSRAAAFVQRLGISVGDRGELIYPEDFREADRRRRILADGYPEAKRLNEAARDQRHVSVPAPVERLKELCEAVPLGSPTWDAWREHHERMGWPFVPQPAGMKVVYFPKGGPEGLEEFERAARSLIAARDEDDAA